MKLLPVLSVTVVFLLSASVAAGDTIRVPKDFETIQEAVDAATDGDTVLVSKGTYLEQVTLRDLTDFVLKGQGRPVLDGEGAGTCLTIDTCTGVQVLGLVFAQAGKRCVNVTESTVVTFAKCRFTNSAGDGLVVGNSTMVGVTRCRFANIAEHGVNLAGGSNPAENCSVTKNRFTQCALAALGVHGDHNLVEKNKIFDSEMGVHVTGSSNDVLKNRLSRPVDGLWLDGSENRIERNSVQQAEFWGLYVDTDAGANLIQRNRFSRPGELGMYVWGTGNRFERNRVSGAGYNGIEMAEGATGNALIANKAAGSSNLDLVDLAPGESNTYQENKFKKTEAAEEE